MHAASSILYQAQILSFIKFFLYVSDRITQTNPIRPEGILSTSEAADDDEAKYRTA